MFPNFQEHRRHTSKLLSFLIYHNFVSLISPEGESSNKYIFI